VGRFDEKFKIVGGKPLCGEVLIDGSKNAVLPILAATLLVDGRSIIHNCPNISDTWDSIGILRHLGCDVVYDGSSLVVDASGAVSAPLPNAYVEKMRSSMIFVGSLLGRFSQIETIPPGGCMLGERPIDLHLKAFEAMGVVFEGGESLIKGKAATLKGTKISLSFPSVGATQNIMLAAVLAKGETIIEKAAKEPEIVDLQGFLNAAGAKVSGAGTSTIVIKGVKALKCPEYTIMPDRIVAGTYLVAGAITRGEVTLKNAKYQDIFPISDALVAMGYKIYNDGNKITLTTKGGIIRPLSLISTGPHPAFPTDMQPQFVALLSTIQGRCSRNCESMVKENVFEARDAHVPELAKMGANITVAEGTHFTIKGAASLTGAVVDAKDLRGGAALILAGLFAQGETIVNNAYYVKRGYADIVGDLRGLGADISIF